MFSRWAYTPHTHELPLSLPWPVPITSKLPPFLLPLLCSQAGEQWGTAGEATERGNPSIYPDTPSSFPLLTIRTSKPDYSKAFQHPYHLWVPFPPTQRGLQGRECSKRPSNPIMLPAQQPASALLIKCGQTFMLTFKSLGPTSSKLMFPTSSFLYSIEDTLDYSLIPANIILWWPPRLCCCDPFTCQDYSVYILLIQGLAQIPPPPFNKNFLLPHTSPIKPSCSWLGALTLFQQQATSAPGPTSHVCPLWGRLIQHTVWMLLEGSSHIPLIYFSCRAK